VSANASAIAQEYELLKTIADTIAD